MSETVIEKAMRIGRMARSPVVHRLILLVAFCGLASLAVTASTSAATLFTNPSQITIPDDGSASPYPSEITVSGLNGPITDISVTLHRFGHADPDDADVLLVSPGGKGVILMSDACGITEVEDFTWTFSRSAPRPISAISGDCADFAYQPANYGGGDFWPSPAPAGPYSTSLDAFDGDFANGTWKLYIVDASNNGASGDIEGGWSLSIDTGPVDAAIPGTGTSGPASFYPATRTISGREGLITDLNGTIDGIWHQNPDDLDLLLVGPQDQKVIHMSDACGSFDAKAFGWVWDDEAPAPMPDGDGTNVSATFSEAMRPGSINRNTFELFKAGTTTRIGATVNYDGMGGRALLNPNSNLRPGSRYEAVVTTGAKDLSGNGLDQKPGVAGNQQKVWFFTTRN
jgi:subtilisin-like proprotein convertase family protein